MPRYVQMTDGGVTAINTTTAPVAPEWIAAPGHVGIGWRLVDGEWTAPVTTLAPRALTRLEFEVLVQSAAGLSDEDFMGALDDPAPAMRLLWRRLGIAAAVERDHPLVQSGFAALIAAGHLTEAQVDAVNAAWPIE